MILHVASLETVPNSVGFKATPSCNVICKLFFFFKVSQKSKKSNKRNRNMFFSVMQKQKERRKHCFVHGWAPDESKK